MKLLDDINQFLTKVERKEDVNKEKITNLPVKRRNKDRKRRWRTHFTQSKSRKRRKELSHRKVLNVMRGFGKGKKLIVKKSLMLAQKRSRGRPRKYDEDGNLIIAESDLGKPMGKGLMNLTGRHKKKKSSSKKKESKKKEKKGVS